MNTKQDEAKFDLFEFEEDEAPPIYDPYRTKNILKDSNTTPVNPSIFKKTGKIQYCFHNQIFRENLTTQTNRNCRKSLRKLLQKLEAIPSPEKKTQNIDTSSTVDILSVTQTLIQKQKKKQRPQSRPQRTISQGHSSKNSKLFTNSILAEISSDSRFQINNRPLKTMASSSSTQVCVIKGRNCQNIFKNENRVRELIREKIALRKKQDSNYTKNSNLLNFLRQNKSAQLDKKRKKEVKNRKENAIENSRKLTNLLLFQ